ncbi:hypothetical protein AWC38_SpisGene23140 [Stylophora pistillata]|uniref:Uncharacterized protein n=1 Tax=Stylophora pistillata TaxID=50429 RepID=A0A2B4R6P8_STYPI|nr:hypothetical protein AWC38_SpisGene23140 [Stylophora pistillata]
MAGNQIRNGDWMQDQTLKGDLSKYVRQNWKKREIVDFIESKYPMYAWSERTLARRLQYFDNKFTNYEVDIEDVKEAVRREMDGPGQLLGYRSMQQKVREIDGLNLPRDVVYASSKRSITINNPDRQRFRNWDYGNNAHFSHAQYDDQDDPVDGVLYGPSTQNKIERWWRELLDRMERFFKSQLSSLVENGDYDPSDQTDSSDASPLQIRPSLFTSFTKGPSVKVSMVTNSLPIDEKKTLWYVKVLPPGSLGGNGLTPKKEISLAGLSPLQNTFLAFSLSNIPRFHFGRSVGMSTRADRPQEIAYPLSSV